MSVLQFPTPSTPPKSEPLERRRADLDVLEWSLICAVLERSGVSEAELLADRLRQRLDHPSARVPS